MYAQYSYLSTATIAQICADLAAIACGETVVANLSAGCDKPGTNIIDNTVTTNWSMFDNAAGAGTVVIRSLNADGISYKYARIFADGTNFSIQQSESWNASTHVAVNPSYVASSHSIPLATGVAGRVFLMAGPRFILVSQNPASGTGSCILIEHSRDTPIGDTSYPCCIHSRLDSGSYSMFTNSSSYPPRHKNPEAAGDLTGSSVWAMFAQQPLQNSVALAANLPANLRGVGEAAWFPVSPINILLSKSALGSVNVPVGRLQGGALLLMHGNSLSFNHLDEIVIGATTYVMFKVYLLVGGLTSAAFLLPKG
jgi:hypothetical protein